MPAGDRLRSQSDLGGDGIQSIKTRRKRATHRPVRVRGGDVIVSDGADPEQLRKREEGSVGHQLYID
jgi:hypothetical protein